jgi:predicted O-methyltransferase YrrM
MFRTGLRFLLRHPFRVTTAVASNPWEAWARFKDRRVEYHWEQRLHRLIGVTWPCEATTDFWALWHQVIGELNAKGIRTGPESFGGWNDGDAGLLRAIWCLTRHLRPTNVVETGVAHGLTSRFILEALEKNRVGHLWSIDKPPLEQALREQIGVAVDGKYPDRWSLIQGSSSQHLPSLISQLGRIDIFVHDSLHTEENVRFELDSVWTALRPGGAIVVDDIDSNRGYRTFKRAFAGHQAMTCEAEPLRPDLRRFNKKGLFGIMLKEPTDELNRPS